ncbi:unnamed protein product [Spirodela intermedia]|uniref:Saposin B-type domain-containing protein n=1 Tax=Spirodela intermedia TaxID=51605 RepID=A0A7I8JZ72_SPIIN|nr:unnamed protein product [Spirodela intermedia]
MACLLSTTSKLPRLFAHQTARHGRYFSCDGSDGPGCLSGPPPGSGLCMALSMRPGSADPFNPGFAWEERGVLCCAGPSRIMKLRAEVLPLLLLLIVCCDGRSLGTSDFPETAAENRGAYEMNRRMCMVCEQFMGQVVEYLKENKTQAEVLEIFHKTCLRLPSFRQQCTILVDYYAPLFFLEVALVSPHDFCRKVSLCEDIAPPPPARSMSLPAASAPLDTLSGERLCYLCHRAISKVLNKLKDPGTELTIVEGLVKCCIVTDHFSQKCQNLIFQYGPVILVSAVRILERANVCVTLHACGGNKTATAAPLFSPAELPSRDA